MPTPHEGPAAGLPFFDAIVLGAGIGGLRMLYELRELGIEAHVFDAAPDVGGTWFWNGYPGARTDSESWVYAYSFSQELQDEWDWSERFPTQPQMLAYLRYVADRFDLRRDITFDSRVSSAVYDEDSNVWVLTTETGERYACTYFIPATGLLSVPYQPDFPGLPDFAGDWYVSGRWPKTEVDLVGKSVAIIGTGATAVQMIPLLARSASRLTVFQRTANFVLPARNYVLTDHERDSIRRNYDDIWEQARGHPFGFAMTSTGKTIADVTPQEHQRILEAGWEAGGFHFLFETLDDISTSPASNEVAAEFVRNKIRSVINDPDTAELLTPRGYPLAAKRPPLGHFYYEAFNRDNVHLVDVSEVPITEITPTGVRCGTTDHDADVIIFATGFDAGTGALASLDIRGRNGTTIQEKWANGPRTYLGIGVEEFPNLFMICGPQSPFANIPVVVDGTVQWIGRAIQHMRAHGIDSMEPAEGSEQRWGSRLEKIVNSTLMPQAPRSWFLGDNIPGKAHAVLFYFGGVGGYRRDCEDEIDSNYDGFALRAAVRK